MMRRDFIALLAGTAATWPPDSRAQQHNLPLLGVLSVAGTDARLVQYANTSFFGAMGALGWDKDRNFERIAREGLPGDQSLEDAARDLVANDVTVIWAIGDPPIRAAQAATATIPIVGAADDMVGSGLVASMARPGGNTTGVSIFSPQLDVKRLELLREAVPTARRLGVLFDPTGATTLLQIKAAATRLGLEPLLYSVANQTEAAMALARMPTERVEAVTMLASPRLYLWRQLVIEARLPTMYQFPEAVAEGGLVSYGPRLSFIYDHCAILIDKILRGAKAFDLPVEQPTVFTLSINLKTATVLGLTIPPSLLARADEVIE
jgi:putative ABC transport system substrate-binding protein